MKIVLTALGVVAAFGLAFYLAFGLFGIQAAFVDNEVDEASPAFGSGAEAETTETSDPAAKAVADEPGNEETTVEVITEKLGTFSGSGSYSVTGNATVLSDDNQRFLRLDSFTSDNGPDLKVWLRSSSGETVNLGALKGNIGDQNYEIDRDVDLDDFFEVVIWCERFSAEFGVAVLK